MACYKPLTGFRSQDLTSSGKRKIVFNPAHALGYSIGIHPKPESIPCGQCIGCRLARSGDWALRIMHESSLYSDNSFITLTYDDSHLPSDQSLHVSDFQKFMKRLRRSHVTSDDNRIRFFHCGEYGDQFGRPHYHCILFNYDFADKQHFTNRDDNKLYTSETLSKLWPFGFSSIGDVSFSSAAYVARYCMKKVTGPDADEHYQVVHPGTGEVIQRKPEYVTMSRRPGIAKAWYDQYSSDCFPKDYISFEGRKLRPPRYYTSQFEVTDPDLIDSLKRKRKVSAYHRRDNNTPDRLKVREVCHESRIQSLKRNLK
jgi:hypothetical protein